MDLPQEYLIIAASVLAFGAVAIFAYLGLGLFMDIARNRREEEQEQTGVGESFLTIVTPEQMVFLSFLSLFLVGGTLYVVFNKLFMGLVGAGLGLLIPQIVVAVIRQNLLTTFENQLVDALTTVSNSLKAGYSLVQAIELVSKEMSPPISSEFGLVVKEHRLGVHLDKALANMSRRVGSPNLDLVVNSITIVRQAGGNIAEVADTISSTIRERNRLEGRISAMTAQGRMQGITLSMIPLFLVAAVNYLQPGMYDDLLASSWGPVVIGIVVMLYLLGGFFIYRIVNVDL